MSRRPWPPFGFAVLALGFALAAGLLFVALLANEPEPEPRLLAFRFATACTLTLAAVAAVALWRVEAWAGHAVSKWGLSTYALVGTAILFLGRITLGVWLFAMLIYFLTGGTAVFLVGVYVRYRLRALPPRLRRPVP